MYAKLLGPFLAGALQPDLLLHSGRSSVANIRQASGSLLRMLLVDIRVNKYNKVMCAV